MYKKNLSERKFSYKDQIVFSKISGDYNPLHLDKYFARKSIPGQIVVHGVNSVLWALENFTKLKKLKIKSFSVRFLNPIFLDEKIKCSWDPNKNLILIFNEKIIFSQTNISLGEINIRPKKIKLYSSNITKPIITNINNYKSQKTRLLKFYSNPKDIKNIYPNLNNLYGQEIVIEIASISRIIGMQMPGLYSIFLGFEVYFNDKTTRILPSFKINSFDKRAKIISLLIKTNNLFSKAYAHASIPFKKNISFNEIRKKVFKKEFSKCYPLIIGGSRGLGASVAKIIAYGGGIPTITYNTGKDDALLLKKEIINNGGKIKIKHLSINKFKSHSLINSNFNQLMYFATPKIFSKRHNTFDSIIYKKFYFFYVEVFNKICKILLKRKNQKIIIFFPSTVAIEEKNNNLREYISAKLKGEKLCRSVNKLENVRVISQRLPRVETDQTLSIISAKSENPLKVMLPIIRKMID